MRQVRWASWMVGMAMALAVGGVRPAVADVRSDQAAAIVDWPNVISVGPTDIVPIIPLTGITLDTVIQLTNTSANQAFAHCFYENANSHCSTDHTVCESAEQCCGMSGCGTCDPGWNETDFDIVLTPRQPLGWLASDGMRGFDSQPNFVRPLPFGEFPLSGGQVGQCGSQPGCTDQAGNCICSNSGSSIPPVPESPFNGSLRCIAVDDTGAPVDTNVLKGEGTLELFQPDAGPGDEDLISVAKHNAIGIQAIQGANDGDNVLCLGGGQSDQCPNGPEYNGCPNVLILNNFFDGAIDPISGEQILTALTLVPCTEDYLRQIPGQSTIQFLVYNEFETRFSTSKSFKCKDLQLISSIDTTQPDRSIFSIGVQGTLVGQTRMNPLDTGSGVLGVATEIHLDGNVPLADVNLHYQGDRDVGDTVTIP